MHYFQKMFYYRKIKHKSRWNRIMDLQVSIAELQQLLILGQSTIPFHLVFGSTSFNFICKYLSSHHTIITPKKINSNSLLNCQLFRFSVFKCQICIQFYSLFILIRIWIRSVPWLLADISLKALLVCRFPIHLFSYLCNLFVEETGSFFLQTLQFPLVARFQ